MYTAEVVDSKKWVLIDNGGRRFGKERRIYAYNNYIPERRVGKKDRRCGRDRRVHPRFP